MPRTKTKRRLSFKPIVTSFVPENYEYKGVSSLHNDEIEAIYLMDVRGMYQEEAAKSMEVSRPTFTRILKNARQKLANGLINGYKILIEDTKDDYKVAVCSSNKEQAQDLDPMQKYILIYQVKDKHVDLIDVLQNPVLTHKVKPAFAFAKLFTQHNINVYVSSKIGEGLKSSLSSRGIKIVLKSKLLTSDYLDLYEN